MFLNKNRSGLNQGNTIWKHYCNKVNTQTMKSASISKSSGKDFNRE